MRQRRKAQSGRRKPAPRREPPGPKQQGQGPISLEEALESQTPTLDLLMGKGSKQVDPNSPPHDDDDDGDQNDDKVQKQGRPVNRGDDDDDDDDDDGPGISGKKLVGLGALSVGGTAAAVGGLVRETNKYAEDGKQAVKKDVTSLFGAGAGALDMAVGGGDLLLSANYARAGHKRLNQAADKNDAGGMTLGAEQRKQGLRDMPSNAAELGSGVSQNLKGYAKNHKLGHLAGTMGAATKGLGIASDAYRGAQGLYQMGKAGARGKRMLDVKKGAGGGIRTPKGGSWYRRIANRNAWKAALQGLKILGAALGIAGLLAGGPFTLISGLVALGIGLGRFVARKRREAGSEDIKNPNAIEKQEAKAQDEQKAKVDKGGDEKGGNEKKADDVEIEAQVDKEIDEQLGDDDHPPTKAGFFSRLFRVDPASKKRRALRKQRKAALKVDKRKLKEARKLRVKELKRLRANKKGFDKTTRKVAKLQVKLAKYKKKGKSSKDIAEVERTLNQRRLEAEAFKKAGFPPEDAAKRIEEAKKVVKDNRQVASEMVGAMQATDAPNPKGTKAEQEHHDSALLTSDVLDLTRREVLSESGQELIEKKMSAWDGM